MKEASFAAHLPVWLAWGVDQRLAQLSILRSPAAALVSHCPASTAFSPATALVPHNPSFFLTTALPTLLSLVTNKVMEVRHGAVAAIAELLPALRLVW